MNDTLRNKRLETARIKTLFTVPFFAPGVAKLNVEFNDETETACTDGELIRWGRKFFDELEDAQIVTVLCHEVCHCLLGHMWRAPGGCDWQTWNEATDHKVNRMLQEFGELQTNQRLANPFPFPAGAFCCDKRFDEHSEEATYEILRREKQGQGGGGDGQGSPKAGKGGAGGGQKPKAGRAGQGGGKADDIEPSRQPFGEIQAPKQAGASGKTPEQSKTDWEATLMQSIAAMKSRGDVPGSLKRYVKELLTPTVPWWELLRSWLREQCADDWNFMKPNRFFGDSEFIMPTLDSERMASVVFGVDTSGSISSELLAKFKGEMQACLDEMKPRSLVEMCCDTRITAERTYHLGDTIDGDAPGGGGTALEKIFERVEKRCLNPKCVVVLTDLETSFPKEAPGYPVLWVVWGEQDKAPFGEVVKVGQ